MIGQRQLARARRRHHDAPALSAVCTTHALGAEWRRTFRQDTQARANASATWSSASSKIAGASSNRPQARIPTRLEELAEPRLVMAHNRLTHHRPKTLTSEPAHVRDRSNPWSATPLGHCAPARLSICAQICHSVGGPGSTRLDCFRSSPDSWGRFGLSCDKAALTALDDFVPFRAEKDCPRPTVVNPSA
jgi:hypothetical protein